MEGLSGFNAASKLYDNYAKKDNKVRESRDAKSDAPAREKNEIGASYEKSDDLRVSSNSKVELSERAQKLLDKLKEKYGDRMDIMVANFSTDEEAQQIMSRGTKDYSVLISVDELEKMAESEETEQELFKKIDDATGNLEKLKEQLEESGEEVKSIGISIADDGTVSYFAELEKASEKQKERIDAAKEAKQEEAAKAAKEAKKEKLEKKPETVKTATVKGSSIDELLENIKKIDWNAIKEQQVVPAGGHFDFSA